MERRNTECRGGFEIRAAVVDEERFGGIETETVEQNFIDARFGLDDTLLS